ncbi:hypothetical protein WIT60_08525 [Aquabacterium sp. G14]|uniref:hypothetical protein n=1 Tax=Aquabacterium sp. G14 TaxID=3130164 RepID=UPI0030AB70C3
MYDEASRLMVDPDFEPLANDQATKPDWFEYWPIRRFFAEADIDESTLYGFLSPKFALKTGLSGADVLAFIESVPQADVVLFSPYPEHVACFLNVFEQQQLFDPGFVEVCQRFFSGMGDECEVARMVHHAHSAVFSNFFFAKPAFWRTWLAVCERLVQASEQGELREGLCEGFVYTVASGASKLVQRKVFVMERIASYLLGRVHPFRVANYPGGKMVRLPHTLHLGHVLAEMDQLKVALAQDGDAAILARFRELQREVLPVVIPGLSMRGSPAQWRVGV